MRRLLLIGGGGHCRSVLDCLAPATGYHEIGIVDKERDACCPGIPVVGNDDDLPRLRADGWTDAFVTVGSIGNASLRRKLFQMIRDIGFSVPPIIAPSADIARDVSIDEGAFVGKWAVINAGSRIGKCAIINTGAIVEHDCLVGDFSHVSPGAVLCGQVSIGTGSHIGAGAVVRQQMRIGEDVLVGMGSIVVKDLPSHVTAYGNPCKVVE